LGKNYGLAAALQAGTRVQAMAQWRREDKDVTSALDLGTLDIRMGFNETRWVNDAAGWISQPFKQIVAQGKNRWLAVASPAGVSGRDNVTSIQHSLGLFDIRETGPTWEIFVGGRKIDQLPATAKQGEPIVIKDGVSYIGIVPLPATDLGRDAEVVIEKGRPQEYKGYQANVGPAVVINSYIYKKDQPLPKDGDHAKVRAAFAGFSVEFGDASEYPNFEAFQQKISQTKVVATYDEAKRELTAASTSGSDTLGLCAVIAPEPGADTKKLADFDPKILSTTWNGQPLFPEGRNILRDTPVTQMAWDRAEKGGASIETSLGRGNRVFLQSFPDKRHFTAWNPQGVLTDFRFSLPGQARIVTDGLIGLARVRVDLTATSVEIDHARAPGRDSNPELGAATAFLLTGFPSNIKIRYNGKDVSSPSNIQAGGASWLVVPIDPKADVRAGPAVEQIWKLLADAKANSGKNYFFSHLNYAGPFPQAEGVYGPEKNPNVVINGQEIYPGEGQDGGDVKWRNYGLGPNALPPLIDERTPQKGVSLFTHHHAQSNGACSYFLHGSLRSATLRSVGLKLQVDAFPDATPRELKLWVNGQPQEITQGKTGLAVIPLKAGENEVLMKVRQDVPREQRTGDKVTVEILDPVLFAPLLTDVEWKTANGEWVNVNSREDKE